MINTNILRARLRDPLNLNLMEFLLLFSLLEANWPKFQLTKVNIVNNITSGARGLNTCLSEN